MKKITFISLFLICLSMFTFGQDSLNDEQLEVIETMNLLSQTTSPTGKGADSYAKYLADDFSRWTIGSSITNTKEKWVEGVREWFDDGWRVSDRQQKNIEIQIFGNYAHTRRIVIETYKGPKGESSTSKAALAEIWIKENKKWLLYRVNVHPIPND